MAYISLEQINDIEEKTKEPLTREEIDKIFMKRGDVALVIAGWIVDELDKRKKKEE